MRRSHTRNESITSQTKNMTSHVLQGVLSLDSQVASAARLNWTPLNFSVIGQLMFLVTVPYRKSLSWNTLRARKRADTKDGSFLGVRGQENGLLHKPKETTPLPSLASPATRAKGKVSRAHVGDVIMCEPKPPHLPPLVFIFLVNLCVRVCADLQTHSSCCFSGWPQQWLSTCIRHELLPKFSYKLDESTVMDRKRWVVPGLEIKKNPAVTAMIQQETDSSGTFLVTVSRRHKLISKCEHEKVESHWRTVCLYFTPKPSNCTKK